MSALRLMLVAAFAIAAMPALAQSRGSSADQNACGRDATRLCSRQLDDGDMAVLACLKANRARLRPVCSKYLTDLGQL